MTTAVRSVCIFAATATRLIVRGLVAIVIALFGGRTAADILEIDPEAIFSRLDLRAHLTAQRSNGLKALVDRIRSDAEAARSAVTTSRQ